MGGFFGGGQNTRTTTQTNISPAQENLISLLTPMQVALAQMQTGAAGMGTGLMEQYLGRELGVNFGGPNTPIYIQPQNNQQPGQQQQNAGGVTTPQQPAGGQQPDQTQQGIPAGINQAGLASMAQGGSGSSGLGMPGYNPQTGAGYGVPSGATAPGSGFGPGGPPSKGIENNVNPMEYSLNQAGDAGGQGGNLPQPDPSSGMVNTGTAYPGDPVQYPNLMGSTLPQGQLPIQGLYTPGQNEMNYPQTVANVTNPLIQALGGMFGQQGQFGSNMMNQSQGLMNQSQQFSGMLPALLGMGQQQVGMSNQAVNEGQRMLNNPNLAGLDQGDLLGAAQEQFNAVDMPTVQAQAVGAGAFGGSGATNLAGTAARNFGLGAGSAIAQQAANLANARTNMAGTMMSSANPLLQGAGVFNQQGGLTNQAAGLSNQASGIAGNLGLGANQQNAALAQVLQNMGLAAPNAAVNLDSLMRQLNIQGAQAPMQLIQALMGGASGMPSLQAPLPQAGSMTTTGAQPTAGAQAGSAISSILPMIMALAMA
jgi:hypothetical protein